MDVPCVLHTVLQEVSLWSTVPCWSSALGSAALAAVKGVLLSHSDQSPEDLWAVPTEDGA